MTIKIFSDVKNKTNLYKIFKPLLIVMLICGFNYSANRNIVISIALKFYFLVLICSISYACMTCCAAQEISLIWSLLEYVVFVTIMAFYKSKIYIFFENLLILDTYLRVNKKYYYRLRNKTCFFMLLITGLRFTYFMVYCSAYVCFKSIPSFVVYEFSVVALDISRVWRYILFEEIWRRLKLLRQRLEENSECNIYLYVKDNKAMRENKLKFCLTIYKRIADLLDLISFELNASLFVGVLCSLPRLVLNVYRILLIIDDQLPLISLGYMLIHITQISLFIFTPCIIVVMYEAEVERIRLFLIHKLMVEKDPQIKEDIHLFMKYTKMRTFSYRVWRIIPINLSLPINMLDLCITYVVVVVNFTKVFT